MPVDIRVLAWNIKDFKGSSFTKHGNKILNVLYDAAGTRQFDIFVVVEPFSKMKKFGVGHVVTEGAGLDGILALYFALAAKDLAWKVVPLRASCKPPKSDMVAVYYYSRLVTFEGPDNIGGGVPPVVTKTATPGGHALPWSAATILAGQVRFYDATPTEIGFHGRRPYLTTWNVPARVTRPFTLTVNAAVGPNLAIATAALPAGVLNRPYSFQLQAQGGTGPYTWAAGGGSNLPAGLALSPGGKLQGTPTAHGNFTLQAVLSDSTPTPAVTANLNFTIANAGVPLAFGTGAALPAAVAGQPYEVILVSEGGTGARTVTHARKLVTGPLPAGMTLAADGTLQWPNPAVGNHTIDVDVADQQVRGFKLVGIHAPPDNRYPNNVNMVQNLADIREITSTRGGIPVAVCGDFNVCPVIVHPNKCYDKKHKATEATALDALRLHANHAYRFTSQNANRRTGLKSAAKAGKDAYAAVKGTANPIALDHLASHAYDHVLTIGFAGVNAVDTVNLVANDPGFANAQTQAQANNPHPIKGLVKHYLWSSGVSDHYPVKFTLQL
jgi:hypothetical protein